MSDTVSISTTPTFSNELDFRESRLSMSRMDSFSAAGDDELETLTHADFIKHKGNENYSTVSFASDKTGTISTTNTTECLKMIASENRNDAAAPPSLEQDPRARAVNYLEKHNILRLFQVRYYYTAQLIMYFIFCNLDMAYTSKG